MRALRAVRPVVDWTAMLFVATVCVGCVACCVGSHCVLVFVYLLFRRVVLWLPWHFPGPLLLITLIRPIAHGVV